MNNTSKLIRGQIPANEPCPFKDACPQVSTCGRENNIELKYSCGYARLFDMFGAPNENV